MDALLKTVITARRTEKKRTVFLGKLDGEKHKKIL